MKPAWKAQILSDVTVSPPVDLACAFPVACRLHNGQVLCAYRQGTEKHSRDAVFLLQQSIDGGRTWQAPVCIYDGMRGDNPESVHAGAICQTNDGIVLAFFTAVAARQTEDYIFSEAGRQLEHRFYVARSEDGGLTWQAPVRHHIAGAPALTYLNSRPLALPDGGVLVPLEITTEVQFQASGVARYESDGGFGPLALCANDPRLSHGDPKLTRLPEGRILMLLWTFVNATEQTIAAHACLSEDEGATWSAPCATAITSQILVPLSLEQNRLIAAGNGRVAPEGIRLWHSRDGGATWAADQPLQMWDAHQEKMLGLALDSPTPQVQAGYGARIWAELPRFTFGTPDLVALGEGVILLTYYVVIAGRVQVRACRFRLEFSTTHKP